MFVPASDPTQQEINKEMKWRRIFCWFLFGLLIVVVCADLAGAQTITTNPQNVSVPAGQTATFSVAFTNGGVCHSVWYATNGIGNVYGPTSASPIVYSVPNVTLSMNGASIQVILFSCTQGNLDPLSATAILTVTPSVPLTSITISPSAPTIAVGAMQAFTAIGNYQDGSTQNITTSVVWSSDTPNVLTVLASGGVATGVAVGTANVSASLNGVLASTLVTVDLSSVTLTFNTNSKAVFDTGAAILPGPIAVSQTAGSTTLPAGTITSDGSGNLSGSLTINLNPQYLTSGNIVLSFGLSIIPNVINYPVAASEFTHGATGLTLDLVLYKNNLDIKSQTLGFTP
jgi:hypothetical protein